MNKLYAIWLQKNRPFAIKLGYLPICQFALIICQRHVPTDFLGRFFRAFFCGVSPVGTGAKYLFLDPHTIRVCL